MTGHDRLEDHVETHRTAVEQKAKNYLQEPRKNFIEKVEEEQFHHHHVSSSPPIRSPGKNGSGRGSPNKKNSFG